MIVQKFQTPDGKLFDRESEAREHELQVGYLSDIERILKKSLPRVSESDLQRAARTVAEFIRNKVEDVDRSYARL